MILVKICQCEGDFPGDSKCMTVSQTIGSDADGYNFQNGICTILMKTDSCPSQCPIDLEGVKDDEQTFGQVFLQIQ